MAKAITAWGIRGYPLTRFCILSDKMRILPIYLQGKSMDSAKRCNVSENESTLKISKI